MQSYLKWEVSKSWRYPKLEKKWVWLLGTGDSFPLRLVPPSPCCCCLVSWPAKQPSCCIVLKFRLWWNGRDPAVAAGLPVLHLQLLLWLERLYSVFHSLFLFFFFAYILIHSFILVSSWPVTWQYKITPFSLC